MNSSLRISASLLLCILFLTCAVARADEPADTCSMQSPGDANSDGSIDSLDIAFLHEFVVYGGPPPNPLANGDVTADCIIDLNDVDYIVGYLRGYLPPPPDCACTSPEWCFCVPGDADGSGRASISDAVWLIQHIFAGGPRPYGRCSSDTNCDCKLTISDVVIIIVFIFGGGSMCENCDDWYQACGGPAK